MVKRCFLIVFVASMALLLGFSIFAHAEQKDLSLSQIWQNKTFSRITYEEDIRDTLRAIARLIGIPITFGEGITDTVTIELEDYPLKKAFDMFMEEYDLDYRMDPESIHVFKKGAVEDLLISLENIEMEEAKRTIDRFGLLTKDMKGIFDSPTNTIFLTGPPREIRNIKNLITTLESSKKKQMEVGPEIRYYTVRYARVNPTQLTIGKKTVTVKGLMNVLTDILDLTSKGEQTPVKVSIVEGQLKLEASPEGKVSIASAQDSEARIIKSMIGAEAGTITSDPRTNRIIIRDYPEKLDEYASIIEQMDKPMKMVKIDVVIVEANKEFAREFGIGMSGALRQSDRDRYFPGTSGPSRSVFNEFSENIDQLDREGNVQTEMEVPTLIPLYETAAGSPISYGLAGTYLYWGANHILALTLAAAEAKGVSRTINKSSIVTMDNMKAIVESKTTVTYKLIREKDDEKTEEDEEIDAGIKLTAVPHIIKTDDEKTLIELVITAERSYFLRTRTDGIPEKASTDLTTQAVIENNNTLVIGGFFENRYAMGETGIPCLMNIPAMGYLFKRASTSNPKNNILFFLTPTVISLDQIPYKGPELNRKIERYENELEQIDPDKREQLIEKSQE